MSKDETSYEYLQRGRALIARTKARGHLLKFYCAPNQKEDTMRTMDALRNADPFVTHEGSVILFEDGWQYMEELDGVPPGQVLVGCGLEGWMCDPLRRMG